METRDIPPCLRGAAHEHVKVSGRQHVRSERLSGEKQSGLRTEDKETEAATSDREFQSL